MAEYIKFSEGHEPHEVQWTNGFGYPAYDDMLSLVAALNDSRVQDLLKTILVDEAPP